MSKKLTFLITSSLLCALPLIASEQIVEQPALLTQAELKNEPSHTHSEPFEPFTGKVIGSKVRLRAHPSLESHVVRETSTGEMFAILNLENDFYGIQPPKGTKGYVFRTYILDGVVEGERVNVRLAPDMDATVVGRLRAGDKVAATVCSSNSKWYEIDLPSTSRFYIAKEYIENIGPAELLAKIEERHSEATHLLNSAFQFGRSEIAKPFEEIDFDGLHQRFQQLVKNYSDLSDIVEKTHEADKLLEETYIQKKIAFLESKADRSTASNDIAASNMKKIIDMGQELKVPLQDKENATTSSDDTHLSETVLSTASEATSHIVGIAATGATPVVTDKMLVWQPLEESLYHLWAASHENKGIEEYYQEESAKAVVISGIVEPYSRPVKNRPGDFLLRNDNLPVAFLYSTKINLQDLVGKKVTFVGAPRPNNNFAFPAYFVLSIE